MDGLSTWVDHRSRATLPAVKDADRPLVGVSASGLDLTARFLVRLQADQVDIARSFGIQSAAVSTPALRPENRRALELLEAWMAEPDDLGEAWWDDFERELQQHRLSLREP
jgi:hypothetical protein